MRRRLPALARIALVIVSIVLLGGCERWPSAGQARTCRSVAPTLNPPDSRIEVRSVSDLAGRNGVEVDYVANSAETGPRRRSLICLFADGAASAGDRPDLVEVRSDGQSLGEIKLAFLKRFWLDTPDGMAADPAPYVMLGQVPDVAPWAALAMQQFVSALPLISIYALLAPSYALIYGLIGRINLAFGEFAAVAAYGALLGSALGRGSDSILVILLLAFGLGLWAAAMHGLALSTLVFAPISRATGQHVLIATIGLALALQEYLRLFQGSALRWVEPVLNQPVGLARSESFVVTITPIAGIVTSLAFAAAAILLVTMHRTHFGRLWRACADDRIAAMLVGVNPAAVLARTFVLASVLAGLAGSIVTVFYGGLGYAGGIVLGLKSLIAAVAGGIGSVPGAFLGGILIGSVEALWSALFPIEYRDVAIYCLLAALLIWRPGGLLGSGDPPPSPR